MPDNSLGLKPILRPIPDSLPDGYQNNATIIIDGERVYAHHIIIDLGERRYEFGTHPDPAVPRSIVVYREVNGGGVIVFAFSFAPDGTVLVAVVRNIRWFVDPTPGATVVEAPRGVRALNESVREVAQREAEGETGLPARELSVELFPGMPVNPNSTFWMSHDPVTGVKDGVLFAGIQVLSDQLRPNGDGSYVLINEVPGTPEGQTLRQVRFVPFNIHELALEGDIYLLAGLLRLESFLLANFQARVVEDGTLWI